MSYTEDGQVYFIDYNTLTSTWTDPRQKEPQPYVCGPWRSPSKGLSCATRWANVQLVPLTQFGLCTCLAFLV